MQKPNPHPRLRDGITSVLGGVNSSLEPDAIPSNQLAFAVNVALRGGYPTSRPGYIRHTAGLQFPEETVQDWWNSRTFQGSSVFSTATGESLLTLSVGGRLFTISPTEGFTVREITPVRATALTNEQISPPVGASVDFEVDDPGVIPVDLPVIIGDGHYTVTNIVNAILTLTNIDATAGILLPATTAVTSLDRNASNLPQAWFEQVEGNLVIQDGQSPTVISNGFTSRRRTLEEVPVGTVMKYHQGRLWVAVDGNQVAVGDIVSFSDPAAVLKFTEINFADGGGRFRVGGEITAITQLAALDQSLGQGPLQVITRDDFNSFNLPAQRESWDTLTYPFQTVSLKNFGALGQYGVQVVNGDCFYRSSDGLRSFVMARRQFGQWGNTPVSSELDRVLKGDDSELLAFTSAVLFDNRLLFTVQPQRSGLHPYFRAIASLDFNPVSGMTAKSPPLWDGIWTGLKVCQLVSGVFGGVERCFVWVQESEGLGLWEISKNNPFDGNGGRIKSWMELPSLKFKKPLDLKRLQKAYVSVSDLVGEVGFTLRFRPDEAACWILWKTLNRCATANSCKSGDCYTLQTFKAGYDPRLSFGQPPVVCSEFTNKSAQVAYMWDLRLEWEGHAKIKQVIAVADDNQEELDDADST